MREAERRHAAMRARDLDEAERIKETRRETMLEHEDLNMRKKEARTADIEKRQEFLQSSLKNSLNII